MGSDLEHRIRNVTAVLGPTNTGKTHLAIERMLAHESGMIGLPLRLLAREVYDKIGNRIGFDKVALITGEEKIKPERARFWVSTVEAMPRQIDVDFLAIDEIQLAADPERGHVFTDRLLHARGRQETLLLGAQTMRETIQDLVPGANFISRPRLSKLTYAGEKKITRMPTRTAVVAFSASEVYSIAELIRRQRGGAAVVLGALSPRTRNAQVALYQSGDVDFLVATDAIGMGLNLDVDHVAFASVRKFDGQKHRDLTASELAQIAGRAGRHMNDGTFGTTGAVEPFDSDLIERLETHNFEPVRVLQWRNRNLDFGSLERLRDSLRELPGEQRLVRARMADDVEALEHVAADREAVEMASTPGAVARLWDVCQIPDYRKISTQNHADLVASVYKFLMGPDGAIPEDWFARQVAFADRTDGDIDTLANRIAHIRTWTFVSNRADWLKDPAHWQGRTREIEDQLSDALHECLTQRFVDKRTSALMKGMRDKDELNAEIGEDGAIHVENHFVGRLVGFRFSPETHADTLHGKASRHAAAQVLSRELGMRARRVASAKAEAFKLTRSGAILWREEEIARIEPTDDPLRPTVVMLIDEHMSLPDREKVQARLDTWISEHVRERLKPLVELSEAEDVTGLARGIAFRMKEGFGILKRDIVAEEIKALDQPSRAQLRKYGVRFGAFNIYQPLLLKPAAAELAATLWALRDGPALGLSREALPEPPRPGLTSISADPATPEAFYRANGFHLCGPRAVRIDILERLADQIRPLLAWRPKPDTLETPPKGSTGDGGFTVTPEMMSILGCTAEELSNVLKSLGFRLERKEMPKPAPVVAPAPSAEVTDVAGHAAAAADAVIAAETTATHATEAASPSVEEVVAAVPADAARETASAASQELEVSGAQAISEGLPPPDAASSGTPAAEAAAAADEPVAAVAETGAGTEADAAINAAAEIVVVEIWRPRRHRAPDQRRDRNRGDRRRGGPPQRSAATEAVPAAAQASEGDASQRNAPEDRAPRGDQQRGRGRDRDRDRSRDREQTRDRGQGRSGERNERPAHAGGHNQGRRDDRGGNRGPRDDRRNRDPRENRRGPQIHSSSPQQKGADPDSPFAALGALKAALEKRSEGKSS